MSVYVPLCYWDGHFWPKKKCLYYVARMDGPEPTRSRLRFCPHHAASIDEHLSKYEIGALNTTYSSSNPVRANCFACGQPLREARHQVFITGYPTQDERKDYWFEVHATCNLPEYLTTTYNP